MDASHTFAAAVHQEEDWYVAQGLEVDVASQGRTIEEALDNLAEAVDLYLDGVADPRVAEASAAGGQPEPAGLPTYSAVVSREGGLWVAVVEGLPAGATDVEKPADLPDAVRDLIASLRGIEPDSFLVELR